MPESKLERALTIVVPALNEAASIGAVIDGLAAAASQCLDRFEIIAVNDGSTDRTGAILDELRGKYPQLTVIHHAECKGVGAGFHAALARASMPFITIAPGDGAYPGEELHDVFRAVGNASHVGTIRANQFAARGLLRWCYSKTYNFVMRWLFWLPVSDLHSLQVYAVEKLRRTPLRQNGYPYGIEALIAADIVAGDLIEFQVVLNSNDPHANRSFRLATLLDLLKTMASFRRRILPGLKSPAMLCFLPVYAVVFVAASLHFTTTPNLQDLVNSPGRNLLLYYGATAWFLPAIVLFPICLGSLFLSLVDVRNGASNMNADRLLLAAIAGAGLSIFLGTILGALGLLHQALLLPLILAVLVLGLLRHPRMFDPFIDWIRSRDGSARYLAASLRLLILALLVAIFLGIALPPDLDSTDVMQIYYAFLARVKSAGDYWILVESPDVSNFLIGRGNGTHLIFAVLAHPFIGRLIGFAYFAGILALVRRIAATTLHATLAPSVDLRRGAWPLLPDLLVLTTVFSSLLQVEFAKFHLQFGFLFVGGCYLLLLQLRGDSLSRSPALIAGAAVGAVALPVILPPYIVFVAILLGALFIMSAVRRDWSAVLVSIGIGGCALAVCAASLWLNHAHVGVLELYPKPLFEIFPDPEKFARFSSPEVWRYLDLTQEVERDSPALWPFVADLLRHYHEIIGKTFLFGLSWNRFQRIADAFVHGIGNSAWTMFGPSLLIVLLAGVVYARLFPARHTLTLTWIALACAGTAILLFIAWPCAFGRECIGDAFPSRHFSGTFLGNTFVAIITSIVGITISCLAVFAAFSFAASSNAAAAPRSQFETRFIGRAVLSIFLIFVACVFLYAAGESSSLNRLYGTLAAVRSVLLFLVLLAGTLMILRITTATYSPPQEPDQAAALHRDSYETRTILLAFSLVPWLLIALVARTSDVRLVTLAGAMSISVLGLAHALFADLTGMQPDRKPPSHTPGPAAPQPGRLFETFDRRSRGATAQQIGLGLAVMLAVLTVANLMDKWRTVARVTAGLSHVLAGRTIVEVAPHAWDFARCIELGSIVEARGRILQVNALIGMIPCYAPTGLQPGLFLHHYNSVIARRYALVLFGEPDEISAFLRSNNVNFFYVDRISNDYTWGHGFSRLFDQNSLLTLFDVEHETPEYYLLTWRGNGKRHVDRETGGEIQALRDFGLLKYPTAYFTFAARKSYDELRAELIAAKNIPIR